MFPHTTVIQLNYNFIHVHTILIKYDPYNTVDLLYKLLGEHPDTYIWCLQQVNKYLICFTCLLYCVIQMPVDNHIFTKCQCQHLGNIVIECLWNKFDYSLIIFFHVSTQMKRRYKMTFNIIWEAFYILAQIMKCIHVYVHWKYFH